MSCLDRTQSNLPIRYVVGMLFMPSPRELRERGLVENVGNGSIHSVPDFSKRVVAARSRATLYVFYRPEHLADGDRIRRPCKQVSAFGATAGIHKPALLESGKN